MILADDMVLIDTYKEGVEDKLKLWTYILEAQGIRISHSKQII